MAAIQDISNSPVSINFNLAADGLATSSLAADGLATSSLAAGGGELSSIQTKKRKKTPSISCMQHIGGEQNKSNQDAMFIKELAKHFRILAICDGHSRHHLDTGNIISNYAVYLLDQITSKEDFIEEFRANPKSTIGKIYNLIQQGIKLKLIEEYTKHGYTIIERDGKLFVETSYSLSIIRGGTTASIVFIDDKRIFCSNIGDSEIFCSEPLDFQITDLKKLSDSPAEDFAHFIETLPILHDRTQVPMGNHSPDNPDEIIELNRKGIMPVYDSQTGNRRPLFRINPITKQLISDSEGKLITEPKPPGSYIKNTSDELALLIESYQQITRDRHYLAMTRAFGDFPLDIPFMPTLYDGVILDSSIIIVCSDGVWDIIKKDEMNTYLRKFTEDYHSSDDINESISLAEYIANKIIEYTLQFGIPIFGSSLDNISCVVYCA